MGLERFQRVHSVENRKRSVMVLFADRLTRLSRYWFDACLDVEYDTLIQTRCGGDLRNLKSAFFSG